MSRHDAILEAVKFEDAAWGDAADVKAILCDEMVEQIQNEVYSLLVWE